MSDSESMLYASALGAYLTGVGTGAMLIAVPVAMAISADFPPEIVLVLAGVVGMTLAALGQVIVFRAWHE